MWQVLSKNFSTKTFWWNILIFALLVGVVALHFSKADQTGVHYHANFQIYINGQPLLFEGSQFYEEASACNAENANQPSSRAHMHDDKAHLIHVHAAAVTYHHFFNNLNIYLSDNAIDVFGDVYLDDQDGRLRFILNDKPLVSLNNKVIRNSDVLLIDFSNDKYSVLKDRYDQIPQDAELANTLQDPQSCSGDLDNNSFWQRLKKAVGF